MKKQFGVEINVIPATVKLGSFFPLKCRTPLPVLSRVVYRFQCLGDQTESYVGMTVRTMSERVKEHLKGRGESAIHDHIASCHSCKQTKISLSNFSILKKCRTQFDTKIHEALLIKKLNPSLNRQLHLNRGASFMLKIFEWPHTLTWWRPLGICWPCVDLTGLPSHCAVRTQVTVSLYLNCNCSLTVTY